MKRILIVSAEPSVCEAVRAALSEKYETLSAASAAEAVELYGRETPELVLCELNLPQTPGLELQRLMFEQKGEPVPFLFMSEDESGVAETLVLDAGAVDYISIPFDPDVLLHRVGHALRQIETLRQLQGLKLVAETDPMTGLLNKTATHKALTELCARTSGIMMMIDLDNFKLVNDLYGHDMGDRLLIRFADILRGVVRVSDDIVGRVGGDEFIIFCRDVRSERLIIEKTAVINEDLIAAAKEYMGEDMNLPLGASAGAVLVPDEGTDFAELYKKADKALYSVKQNGKHNCAFSHEREAAPDAAEARRASSATLADAHTILEERNRLKGAYEVGFEQFRTIYRFLIRRVENSHYDVEFVLFSFAADVPEDKVNAFGALLRQTLRRSDVYTKSSRGQYMVLLPQPAVGNGEAAIRRVLEQWKCLGGENSITCEHESLLSRA